MVFSGYGFAVAMFALMQGIASNGKLYWLRTPQSGGWIYGPYVNHNHYAGLMEMLTPIPLVISLSRRRSTSSQGIGGSGGGSDGEHDFSVWIARRHGCLRCAVGSARSLSDHTTEELEGSLRD